MVSGLKASATPVVLPEQRTHEVDCEGLLAVAAFWKLGLTLDDLFYEISEKVGLKRQAAVDKLVSYDADSPGVNQFIVLFAFKHLRSLVLYGASHSPHFFLGLFLLIVDELANSEVNDFYVPGLPVV
jgi:hypothetical protein